MINYEPITLDRQEEYLKYFDRMPEQAADYTFINLFGLKDIYDLRWTFTDDLVWIQQYSPYTLCWAPVGGYIKPDMLESCVCKSLEKSIIRIPNTLAKIWEEKSFVKISEMRDEWEYVYDRQELIDLAGKKYHNKKNLCNQFEKYDAVYHSIDSSWIPSLREFEKKWKDNEMKNNVALDENSESFDKEKMRHHEVRAEADMVMIETIFDNWDNFIGIKGGALTVGEKIVAYAIGCGTMRDMIVVHAERGDRDYKGSYQAINRYFLKNECEGYKYVNREQDVGDEGLRRAKMSYNPVKFVEKYSAHCVK